MPPSRRSRAATSDGRSGSTRAGISPLFTTSAISSASASCGRFHSEKFSVARPLSTSCCTIHETGATLLYQGQVVSFEWQSKHASLVSCRTCADDPLRLRGDGRVVVGAPIGHELNGEEERDPAQDDPFEPAAHRCPNVDRSLAGRASGVARGPLAAYPRQRLRRR